MPKSSWNTIDLSLTPMEKFHGLMDLLSIIPVIGIGIPTVLDAATIVLDTLKACSVNVSEDRIVDEMKLKRIC